MKYPVYIPEITEKERKYVNECLDSTWISSKGKFIEKFENLVASFTGVKNAIAVCNGTVAIHVILEAYGIGKGDEVIIPDFTYIATANAVKYTGAKVVFADVDLRSWNITVEKISSCATSNTKAVIVTDIYGTPPEMDEIREYCIENKFILIEDAAESLGGMYKNKMAGNLADAATLSFFGNKTITTGEGGMVLTNQDDIAKKLRKLRNQGNSEQVRYFHDILGYNYRMTNIQAAIGCAQMERIESIINRKKKIYELYKNELDGLVRFQKISEYIKSSYWMVSFTLGDKFLRDKLMNFLLTEGIETRPFFYPVSQMPFYENSINPNSEKLSETGLNVPSYPTLSNEDVKWICSIIRKRLKAI